MTKNQTEAANQALFQYKNQVEAGKKKESGINDMLKQMGVGKKRRSYT
jgi:hypothetical protein